MSYLEFDIVEFLQATDGLGNTTGTYFDFTQLAIHKYYSGISSEDEKLYIYDWSQEKYLNLNGNAVDSPLGISREEFVNTANSQTLFVHKYTPNIEYPYGEKAGKGCRSSYSVSEAVRQGKLPSGSKIQDTYTYGFYWSVDESNKKYNLVIYVDFNNDGNMTFDERIYRVDETYGHKGFYDIEFTDPIYGTDIEFDTWNQYAYILLDNAFYTSNPTGAATGVAMHTDLLEKNNDDKATFEVEYVRVYQENGRRDIITPDTEFFNTDDHFGYGDND